MQRNLEEKSMLIATRFLLLRHIKAWRRLSLSPSPSPSLSLFSPYMVGGEQRLTRTHWAEKCKRCMHRCGWEEGFLIAIHPPSAFKEFVVICDVRDDRVRILIEGGHIAKLRSSGDGRQIDSLRCIHFNVSLCFIEK